MNRVAADWSRIVARNIAFDAILAQAEARDLTSNEHVCPVRSATMIDGLVSSLKSVRAKDGLGHDHHPDQEVGVIRSGILHGQKRKNDIA